MKKITLLLFTLFLMKTGSSQIIISLLLGDKLNSDKLEFGLDGGLTVSNLRGVDNTYLRTFNLGFYFDLKTKNPKWSFVTGVMVKANGGGKDLATYPLANQSLDTVFQTGSVTRKFNTFYVPVGMKYMVCKQFFLMGGIQLGLNTRATDEFVQTVNDEDDTHYSADVKNDFKRIEGGVTGGIGYRLMGGNGMNLIIRGYMGLTDISNNPALASQYNQALYFNVGIPIGKAPKK